MSARVSSTLKCSVTLTLWTLRNRTPNCDSVRGGVITTVLKAADLTASFRRLYH